MAKISGLVVAAMLCLAHFAQSEKCVRGTSQVCTPFTYNGKQYDDCAKAFNSWCLAPGQTGSYNDYSYCGECLEPATTTAEFRPRPFTPETTIPTTTTTAATVSSTTTTAASTATTTPIKTTTTTAAAKTSPTTTKTIPTTTTTIHTTTKTIPTVKTAAASTPTPAEQPEVTSSESREHDDVEDDVTASGDAADVTTSDDEEDEIAVTSSTEAVTSSTEAKAVTSSASTVPEEETVTSLPVGGTPGEKKTRKDGKKGEKEKQKEKDQSKSGSSENEPNGSDKSRNGNILMITIVACSIFLITGILTTVFIFRRRFRRNDSYETEKNDGVGDGKEAAIPLAEYRHKGALDSNSAEQNRISSADGDKADDDVSKPALA